MPSENQAEGDGGEGNSEDGGDAGGGEGNDEGEREEEAEEVLVIVAECARDFAEGERVFGGELREGGEFFGEFFGFGHGGKVEGGGVRFTIWDLFF